MPHNIVLVGTYIMRGLAREHLFEDLFLEPLLIALRQGGVPPVKHVELDRNNIAFSDGRELVVELANRLERVQTPIALVPYKS